MIRKYHIKSIAIFAQNPSLIFLRNFKIFKFFNYRFFIEDPWNLIRWKYGVLWNIKIICNYYVNCIAIKTLSSSCNLSKKSYAIFTYILIKF